MALIIEKDITKSCFGLIISVLLRILEKSNKIVSRSAHVSISNIIKSNTDLAPRAVPLIVEFGHDNRNKFVRKICVELLKETIEFSDDKKSLDSILRFAGTYIKKSAADSCNVVRENSKKIMEHIEKYNSDLFQEYFGIRNSIIYSENSIKSSAPSLNLGNSEKEITTMNAQKSKGLGKAQRVRIFS